MQVLHYYLTFVFFCVICVIIMFVCMAYDSCKRNKEIAESYVKYEDNRQPVAAVPYPKIATGETVYFQLEKDPGEIKDTHKAYNIKTKEYTIVRGGTYVIIKTLKAGEVIKNPTLVRGID